MVGNFFGINKITINAITLIPIKQYYLMILIMQAF